MEKNSIILSVVVPVYNVKAYLNRCLNSILNQKYIPDEIICVDDGSTDGSSQILDEYAEKYNNIRVIHKANNGLVSARKAGLKIARGKYVTYVDSDDWIENNMYEEMLKEIELNHADLVTSGCIRDYDTHIMFEEENIPAGVYEGIALQKEIKERLIEANIFFKSNLSIHIYNKIYLKSKLIAKQMQIDNRINIGEDAACVYPYILDSEKIVVMGKSYYHYCIRNYSIMGSPGIEEYKNGLYLKKLLKKEFLKHGEIKGIINQYKNIVLYCSLLQYAPKEVIYKDGILVPYGKIAKTDRIIIYGAGRFGIELHKVLINNGLNVVAWIDKKEREGITKIDNILNFKFDKILIAVLGADMCNSILDELHLYGVEFDKIMKVNPYV